METIVSGHITPRKQQWECVKSKERVKDTYFQNVGWSSPSPCSCLTPLVLPSAGSALWIPAGSRWWGCFPPIPPFPCIAAHLGLNCSRRDFLQGHGHPTAPACIYVEEKKWTRNAMPTTASLGRNEGAEGGDFLFSVITVFPFAVGWPSQKGYRIVIRDRRSWLDSGLMGIW